jgi:hypothetical protein
MAESYPDIDPKPVDSGKTFIEYIGDLEEYIVLNTEGKVTAPILQNLYKNLMYTIPLSGATNFNINALTENDILSYRSGKWENSDNLIISGITSNADVDLEYKLNVSGITTLEDNVNINSGLNLNSTETIYYVQGVTGITNSTQTLLTEEAIANYIVSNDELSELNDVDLNSSVSGEALIYDGSFWVNIPVYNTGQTYDKSEIDFLASVSGLTDTTIINPTSGYTDGSWGYPYNNYKANDTIFYSGGTWVNDIAFTAQQVVDITMDLTNLSGVTDGLQAESLYVNKKGLTDYPNSDGIGDFILITDGDSGMTWQPSIKWMGDESGFTHLDIKFSGTTNGAGDFIVELNTSGVGSEPSEVLRIDKDKNILYNGIDNSIT